MKKNKSEEFNKDDYFNIKDLECYIKVPAGKKLDFLEETARFLHEATPPESKKIWLKLKEMGF